MPIQSTAAPSGDASQPLSVPALTIWIAADAARSSRMLLADLEPCGPTPGSPHTKITIEVQPGAGLDVWAQTILDLEGGWIGRLDCSEQLKDLFGAANDVVAGYSVDLAGLLGATPESEGAAAAREDLELARSGQLLGAPAEEDADPDDLLEPTVELDADGNLVLA